MKELDKCEHKNKETITIGGVTFTRLTLCNDCGKILDRSDKNSFTGLKEE